MSKGMDVIRERLGEVQADRPVVRSRYERVEYRLAWSSVALCSLATGWFLCELVNLLGP